MRSLVFIALLGLALAVPVPHARSNLAESEIFTSYELPEDCYADEDNFQQAQTEDDLQIDNIVVEDQENCDDEPIMEEDLVDIEIDFQPGNDVGDIIIQQEYEVVEDEDCIDEVQTEEPPVITRPTEKPYETVPDNADCYGEEYEEIDVLGPVVKDEPQLEPLDSANAFERGFVEVDQVFNTEYEQEAEGLEECIEY